MRGAEIFVSGFARVACAGLLLGLVACSGDEEPTGGTTDDIVAPSDPDGSTADLADPIGECGDGVCDPDESFDLCAEDCPKDPVDPFCGDGVCGDDEDFATCAEDCPENPGDPVCGNGTCEAGEDFETCAEDCPKDPVDPVCGDGVCGDDEDETSCPEDCHSTDLCGNGVCDPDETEDSCAADCTPADECEIPSAFQCACEENSDCQSGYCVPTGDGFQCSKPCEDDCPDGWSCKLLGGSGDNTFICLPKFSNLCRPCEVTDDCKDLSGVGGECVPFPEGQGSFCGGDCSEDSECPDGYSCNVVDLGDDTSTTQCQPDTGVCLCNQNAVDAAAQTACSVTNDAGTCSGLRVCEPGGLTACDAPAAEFEICDGLDNDCDGEADEADEVDLTCENTNEYGTCTGIQKCVDGTNEDCDAATPAEELCDGEDNNCDGIVDEGFEDLDADNVANCVDPDIDGDGLPNENDNCPEAENGTFPQPDHDGDGIGDACDDDIDNDGLGNDDDCDSFDDTITCTTYYWDGDGDTFGNCTVSKCLCEPQGNYTVLSCDDTNDDCNDDNEFIKPGVPEECDGFDNDCNGLVDDGEPDFDGDLIQDACDDDIDGDGVLNEDDCNSADPTIPTEDGTEYCNGVDDNCDGSTDEGFDGLNDACDGDDDDQCLNGVTLCNLEGTGTVCEETTDSVVEICDGADNDCDGEVDELWPELGDACDTEADSDFCANGVIVCTLDGIGTECGEETEVDIAEICDGQDNDCDSETDEDWPDLGAACDSDGDVDLCDEDVLQCTADGSGLECVSEDEGILEICGNELDDNCDGVVNEACQPASVDFTFSGFFMSPEPAEALGEGFTIELTGAEVGVTGSSPSQDGAGYSVDFGFHATTLNQ